MNQGPFSRSLSVGLGGPTVCSSDRCLPSGNAAVALMEGDLSAFPMVLATTAMRGTLVAGGLAIAGARGKELLKYTVAGTLAIETFVLGWAWWQARKERQP